MNANELRIGNWVYYEKDKCNVQVGIGDFLYKENEYYTPIPITEEILLKCGFEWRDDLEQKTSLVLDLKSRQKLVYYSGDICCLSIYQNNDCVDFAYSSHTELHQLQNLYFALINEELNIEL